MVPIVWEYLEIAVLAVVQGVTEFLPISSSGHVIVLAALFDRFGHPLDEKLTINIALHMGSLLAIVFFYRERIARLFGSDRRLIGLILVGSVPAGLAGVAYKKFLEAWFVGRFGWDPLEDALLAGIMFAVTGGLLMAARRWESRHGRGAASGRELTYPQALWIGVFQALAILPGLSRSGSTIAAGLFCGMKRDEAAAFSFLLALPAMAGAGLLEALDAAKESGGTLEVGPLLVGGALAFVIGWASLRWLIAWLQQGRLGWFAAYVFALSPLVIAWRLLS
ncbi:MAG: undecaprenyl-diphosphate phosphatase [Thermogutta sp.]